MKSTLNPRLQLVTDVNLPPDVKAKVVETVQKVQEAAEGYYSDGEGNPVMFSNLSDPSVPFRLTKDVRGRICGSLNGALCSVPANDTLYTRVEGNKLIVSTSED